MPTCRQSRLSLTEKPCRLNPESRRVSTCVTSKKAAGSAGSPYRTVQQYHNEKTLQTPEKKTDPSRVCGYPGDRRGDPLKLSTDSTQREKQVRTMVEDMMTTFMQDSESSPRKSAGWERPRPHVPLTTSPAIQEKMRFHAKSNAEKQRDAPSPKENSYHMRQAIRFHESPSRRAAPIARSLTPESGSVRSASVQPAAKRGSIQKGETEVQRTNSKNRTMTPDRPLFRGIAVGRTSDNIAAGSKSDSRMRRDTPASLDASLGRTRSHTPDYYRRYGENLQGTSLPGSNAAAAEPTKTPRTPRSIARKVSECDPRKAPLTPSYQSKSNCRFYDDSAPSPTRAKKGWDSELQLPFYKR